MDNQTEKSIFTKQGGKKIKPKQIVNVRYVSVKFSVHLSLVNFPSPVPSAVDMIHDLLSKHFWQIKLSDFHHVQH